MGNNWVVIDIRRKLDEVCEKKGVKIKFIDNIEGLEKQFSAIHDKLEGVLYIIRDINTEAISRLIALL